MGRLSHGGSARVVGVGDGLPKRSQYVLVIRHGTTRLEGLTRLCRHGPGFTIQAQVIPNGPAPVLQLRSTLLFSPLAAPTGRQPRLPAPTDSSRRSLRPWSRLANPKPRSLAQLTATPRARAINAIFAATSDTATNWEQSLFSWSGVIRPSRTLMTSSFAARYSAIGSSANL